VPLKQIQEWLGHSTFAITADTYAHLEFSSKLQSAQAMTWIDRTSLAQLPGAKTPLTVDSDAMQTDNAEQKESCRLAG
jgi:hypothetical protein